MRKFAVIIVIAAVAVVAAGVGGFLLGRGSQADSGEEFPEVVLAEVIYAEILSAENGAFHVKGLDINDINGRSEYVFGVDEDTQLIWRGTPLSVSDFEKGDKVAVYYDGMVLESFPGQIPNVMKIKLLDDEV